MREIDLTPTYQEAMRLVRLRRRASLQGLKLTRSRWHRPYVRNRGGLALLDSQNEVIAGDGYSLDLDAAEALLSTMIDQGTIPMPQHTRKSGREGVDRDVSYDRKEREFADHSTLRASDLAAPVLVSGQADLYPIRPSGLRSMAVTCQHLPKSGSRQTCDNLG